MQHIENWFWNVLARYKSLYFHVLIASFIVNLLSLAMPLFVMNVYDRIVPNNAFESLWVLSLGMLIATGLDFFLRMARTYFVDTAGRNADVKLQSLFMHALLNVRFEALYSSYDTANVGSIIARIRELEYVRNFLGSRTVLAITDLPFVLLFITLIFYLGGTIGFIPLLALPLLALFSYTIHKVFYKASLNAMRTNAQKQSFLTEMVTSLETIRATRMDTVLMQTWNKKTAQAADAQIHSTYLTILSSQGVAFLNIMLTVLVVIVGVYRISEGLMTTGSLIACVILFGRTAQPLNALVNILVDYQQTSMTLKRFGILLNMPMENALPTHALEDETPSNTKDNTDEQIIAKTLAVPLYVEKVGFSYPSSFENNVQMTALKDINITIEPGGKVGFVGASGSGKSTLARLIAGLYTPTEGRILLGQVDMKNIPMRPYRNKVGFLPQEIRLFQGTLRHNIALAWPSDIPCTEEDILKAATLAGVMEFAQHHPLGLDMPLGERGLGLSSGQAQCVALARALLGDPHTIILDEPAAQLDDSSSQKLIRGLAPYLQDKTVILFTHKAHMLQLVNTVIAMEKGSVIWSAPTHEVLKQKQNNIQSIDFQKP